MSARRIARPRQVPRIFLLSPAKVSGARAQLLASPLAPFALARQFQREGLPLADVFAFASALYFRAKITYARRFVRTTEGELIRVITTNAGLVDPLTLITPASLEAFGAVEISEDDPRYRRPLERDAKALAARLDKNGAAILLGSIATAKYRNVLLAAFGARLVFPSEFVGRGDMSRGRLLLRHARAGTELTYARVHGAITRGKRAPRLAAP